MKYLIKLLSITWVCVLMMHTQVRAEITPQLLQEWSRQPSNVQWNVYNQHTAINVVDQLPWQSSSLADTWAYTNMNVQGGYVQSIDMVIKRGYESALTHEVGHCISNYNGIPYYWCYTADFQCIWQTEKYNNVLLVGQGEDDPREYFATSYDLLIRFPQLLKTSCPRTYNYLIKILAIT